MPIGNGSQGCYLGDREVDGKLIPVCIPQPYRDRLTCIIGESGQGKSKLLLQLIIDDILRGDGCVILDPFGNLSDRLLDLIPPEHAARTVLLSWHNQNCVPLLNPLDEADVTLRGHRADALTRVFRDGTEEWGDCADHVLRSVLHGILHLQGTTLANVRDVLNPASTHRTSIKQQVLTAIEDSILIKFWKDPDRFPPEAFTRVRHALDRLLYTPHVASSFTQPANTLNIADSIAQSKVLIVDLAGVRAEARRIIGSLILSMLALARISTSRETPVVRVHIDEAQIFTEVEAITEIMICGRRSGISMCLCCQKPRQCVFDGEDAATMAATMIRFPSGVEDAQRSGPSDEIDLSGDASLQAHEAIARIGEETFGFKTRPVLPSRHSSCRNDIIGASHCRYYGRTTGQSKLTGDALQMQRHVD